MAPTSVRERAMVEPSDLTWRLCYHMSGTTHGGNRWHEGEWAAEHRGHRVAKYQYVGPRSKVEEWAIIGVGNYTDEEAFVQALTALCLEDRAALEARIEAIENEAVVLRGKLFGAAGCSLERLRQEAPDADDH